jgi:hypothetical protein
MGAQHLSHLCQTIETDMRNLDTELKILSLDRQLLNNILSAVKIEQQYICSELRTYLDNKQF